jgi:MoaA/NifB/PqqE/SkfB family radical SAM enzyme
MKKNNAHHVRGPLQIWRNKPLKAFVNVLRSSLERRRRRVSLKSRPFILYYEPTTSCNLKCPSCPTGTGDLDRPKSKVSLEQFKATIDAIGDWVFVLYMYNWGEPLLHKDFDQLVRYATDKGIVVRTSSNLSLPLSQERCEAIVKSGLQSLKVGIDGASPEVHAMYRRGSNLELVHKNVRTLAEIKKRLGMQTPAITVSYHVFAHNEAEIEEFSKQMPELGVNSFNISPSWLPPDNSVSAATDARYNMYEQVNKVITKLHSQKANLKPCSWLYYASVINPNGNISPCCGVASEKSDFGQLPVTNSSVEMREGFDNEWNGRKYTASRKLFSDAKRTEKWADKNLHDLHPDGMAFSSIGVPMICAKCPIPHTLEQWCEEVWTLYGLFRSEVKRSVRRLDLLGAVDNAAKAVILRIAAQFQ